MLGSGKMNDMKINIRRVFWLYFFMFLMIVLYLGKFIVFDSRSTVNSTYNPRLNITDNTIKRGSIIDAKGNIIAESVLNGGAYGRVYAQGRQFAHIAGYISSSKSGIEAKYNFDLQTLDLEIVQRVDNLITGSPLTGDSVHLTIDSGLQEIAYHGLGSNRGGVVAMEPSTGKILAMASYPNFDPNTVADSWGELSQDSENSPLLNRASQGLYPPGSVFKIVSAVAVMNGIENWEDFHFECTGEITVGDNRIRCYNSTAHGMVDLAEAVKVSCNTYFAYAGIEMGPEEFKAAAEKAYFNQTYAFDLERVMSRFSMEEGASESEIMETAIGQGKTLVTPLHMAMITSAAANGGKMMEPYVCDYLETKGGGSKSKTLPKMISRIFSAEESQLLTEMMVDVVDSGTGRNAAISGVSVAGKTGTAENASGDAHGWFIAFAPADNPQIAVAVVVENAGGSQKAIAIARELIVKALE